jgi:hypothetical protein
MLRFLMILFLFFSCSPKVSYNKHRIGDDNGYDRQHQIYKITKYNQRKMNKVRKRAKRDVLIHHKKRKRKYFKPFVIK